MTLLRHSLARRLRTPRVQKALNLARAAGLTALASGAMVLGVSHYSAFARVHQVEVVGNSQASAVAVRHLADVHLGDPLLLLDLGRVVDEVVRHPWVAEATASRVYPGGLQIEVVEHRDVLLMAHDGALYRVSDAGEVFVKARGVDLDRPVLTGVDAALVDGYPAIARRVVSDSLALLAAVEASPALNADALSELHFDASLGYSLKLRNGSVIYVGFDELTPRIKRLEAMIDAGLDLTTPARVDLDLNGMAVAAPLGKPIADS